MAYSANGYNFPNKSLGRVKYDLLTDDKYIPSTITADSDVVTSDSSEIDASGGRI